MLPKSYRRQPACGNCKSAIFAPEGETYCNFKPHIATTDTPTGEYNGDTLYFKILNYERRHLDKMTVEEFEKHLNSSTHELTWLDKHFVDNEGLCDEWQERTFILGHPVVKPNG